MFDYLIVWLQLKEHFMRIEGEKVSTLKKSYT